MNILLIYIYIYIYIHTIQFIHLCENDNFVLIFPGALIEYITYWYLYLKINENGLANGIYFYLPLFICLYPLKLKS